MVYSIFLVQISPLLMQDSPKFSKNVNVKGTIYGK